MKQMMIGNAHIDPVWFWRWQEGYHEVKATFRSALDRMNETPGFIFTSACADYYRWVEENAPDLFEEIRRRVQEGRWVIVGGMWIQPDMNIPSGESIARHLMMSQRYFKDRFGITVQTGYNVDTFGHNAMLPQLLQRAGISSYVWMRPQLKENSDIPQGSMLWESPDGSRVAAHRIACEYTRAHELPEKIDQIFELSVQLNQPMMCFYGVGNHGGGPTIENLAQIEAYKGEGERGSEVDYGSPDAFFALLEAEDQQLPVWKDELQHHASGCYSTHSASKKKMREAENALLRMEKLGVLSHWLTGHELQKSFVKQAWQNVLFNQFHDAMGGCSAEDVLNDVVLQLNESLSIAAREENAALQKISWQVDTSKGLPYPVRSKEEDRSLWGIRGQGTPVVVFNPHEFEAEGTVQIRRPIRMVRDDNGRPVPVQAVRAARTNHGDITDGIFRAKVPALGYRLYWIFLEEDTAQQTALSASNTHLENEFIRAEFDPKTGALTHLSLKADGRNLLCSPLETRLMDVEHCDTWAHGVFAFDKVDGVFQSTDVRLMESGPVRAVLRVRSVHQQSLQEIRYTLYAGAKALEMDVCLDLRERHRMVKLCIPTIFRDGCDVSEIPYGTLCRTACGNEEPCQRYVAMQGADGGLALVNNGRYSYSAKDGELLMTAAHTAIFADHYGQQLRDDGCRYMDQGEMHFSCALVPYQGQWQQAGLHHYAAVLNQELPFVVETYHAGRLPGEMCGLQLNHPSVQIGAVKEAEDGAGIVFRLTETSGEDAAAVLEMPLAGRSVPVSLHPFEIQTLYVPHDPAKPCHTMLLTELA